ncbi:MAG: shikimate dehydrogenase [Pseudomonadota bacterium]
MMSEDPRPRLAGVCGAPIAQSKSPLLFKHWFQVHGIQGHYVPMLIQPEDFDYVARALPKAGYRGINVTLPHKGSALGLADESSPAAKAIGAANTLTFREDGRIHADNTDGFGFIENLKAGAPEWDPAKPVVMLGAGGAARAGIFVLLEAGVPEIRLTNRTREKADALTDHFGARVQVYEWSDRSEILSGAGAIINSTSLGMIGKPALDISLNSAKSGTVVTDMVYNPLITPLLAQAKQKALPIVDGLGMLLHQARPGFRRWFGQDPKVTPALRDACLGSGA